MNRVAEFFGYKWRMPLFDKRFVSYWNQVPDKFKIDQKMYTKTIKRTNPANVWTRSIPVNKKKIYPIYLRYFRNFLKIFFIFLGSNSIKFWHLFDAKYLYYFYDVTRMVSLYSYKDYIKSKNNSVDFCHVSLQSKKYLEKYEIFFKKN